MAKVSSNTGEKVQTSKKKMPRGKRFEKGFDPRRNLNGRPRKFDELREMVLDIFNELTEDKKQKQTRVRSMLNDWVNSMDGFKQNRALEIGYGKVPDEIHHIFDMDEFMRKYINKFTDGQLKRIQAGEHPLDVLMDALEDKR